MNITALKRIGNSLITLREATDDLTEQAKLQKLINDIDILIIESDIK